MDADKERQRLARNLKRIDNLWAIIDGWMIDAGGEINPTRWDTMTESLRAIERGTCQAAGIEPDRRVMPPGEAESVTGERAGVRRKGVA